MKEVYDSRAMTVDMKKKVKDESNWLKDYEKKQIQDEIDRQNLEFEQKKINEAMMLKNH